MTSPTARPTDPVDFVLPPTSANDSHPPTSSAPNKAQNLTTRAARLRDRLGDRDLGVLGSLRQFRLLSGHHIQRLHVADGSEKTRARRSRALVQRLAKLGLVVRFGRSVGGIRAGSKGHTIGLTGLGEAVLDVGQDQGRRHRQVWEGKPYFQDHTLAIAELHTSLTEHIAANGDADLIAFETEPKVWRRFGGIGGSLTLKPDYLAHIGVGDIERVVFVEIDLGTESLPSVLRKCQVYLQYWQAGIEQHLHGLFPSVLWLVPDGRRRGRLQEGVERLPRDAQALFTIALLHEGAQLLTTNGGLA